MPADVGEPMGGMETEETDKVSLRRAVAEIAEQQVEKQSERKRERSRLIKCKKDETSEPLWVRELQ